MNGIDFINHAYYFIDAHPIIFTLISPVAAFFFALVQDNWSWAFMSAAGYCVIGYIKAVGKLLIDEIIIASLK
jgi:hypothetical protein